METQAVGAVRQGLSVDTALARLRLALLVTGCWFLVEAKPGVELCAFDYDYEHRSFHSQHEHENAISE